MESLGDQNLQQEKVGTEQEEYSANDINREKFDYIVLGTGLTENILGA